MAFVFGSLEGVKAGFKLFYDLLAFESVTDNRYRALFQEAEGQPIRHAASFRAAPQRAEFAEDA